MVSPKERTEHKNSWGNNAPNFWNVMNPLTYRLKKYNKPEEGEGEGKEGEKEEDKEEESRGKGKGEEEEKNTHQDPS